MEKGKLLYEGKAKQVYATNDDDLIIMHYKNDATAGKIPTTNAPDDGRRTLRALLEGV